MIFVQYEKIILGNRIGSYHNLDWVYGFTVFSRISLFMIITHDMYLFFYGFTGLQFLIVYPYYDKLLLFILEWVYRFTVFYCISKILNDSKTL